MKKIILSTISFIWIAFIFINSSQNGVKSHKESIKFAHEIFGFICKYVNVNTSNEDFIVRKCAHGFEFMVLAIVLMICISMFNFKKRNIIIFTLLIVLIIAICDETFQLFIPGRTSNRTDVLIDFLGGTVGCIIASLFTLIHHK